MLYDQEGEYDFSEDSITQLDDGTFLIRGDADLEDCDTVLGLKLDEDEALKEFATLSGFLCMCAGEIPSTGDIVRFPGWSFDIINADDKKILSVRVERVEGDLEDDEEMDNNPIRSLLKLNLGGEDDSDGDSDDDGEVTAPEVDGETSNKVFEVDYLVTSGKTKIDSAVTENQKEDSS